MAATLLDSAKLYPGDPLRAGVIQQFARESDLLRVLPFETIVGSGVDATREDILPGVGFRAVNSAYTEDAGQLDRIKESLRILGGDLDVDKFIVDTQGVNQRTVRTLMKVTAAALKFNATVIKGDATTNPEEFDGLQKRLTSASGQLIANSASSGGAALSLQALTDAIDAVDRPTHLVMSKKMRNRLSVAARTPSVGGNITYELDQFGQRITMFDGLPILIADKDNENNLILPFTEAHAGGGTANGTSIYVISAREGMFTGIQHSALTAVDMGLQQAKPVYRTRVEWYASIVLWHIRGASRLYSITDAAVVA